MLPSSRASKILSFIVLLSAFCKPLFAFAAIPLVWNITAANEYFVGRKSELKELEKLLSTHHKVVVVGTGGIGKTQLVKKFAHEQIPTYQIIWWFDIAKNIDDQLILFAEQLNEAGIGSKINIDKVSSGAILIHIKEVLRKTDKKWLLIFDNAKNLDIVSGLLPETHNMAKKDVIITSRNSNTDLKLLHLSPFNEADAAQFMEKATNIQSNAEMNYMISLLNGYPIALAGAATYLKTNNIKPAEYVALFKQDPHKLAKDEKLLLETENNHFDLNKTTIETTLSLNLQNLKEDSELGFEIIQLMSLIKRPQVPGSLLFDFADTDKKLTKEEFNAAIRALKKHSLIEEAEKEGSKYYFAHDLIKQITKRYILTWAESEDSKYLARLYKKLLKVMALKLDRPWSEMIDFINDNTELINIANAIVFAAYKDKIYDPTLVSLTIALLEHNNMVFHIKSSYTSYQALSERLYEMLQLKEIDLPLSLESRYYFNAIYSDYIFKTDKTVNEYKAKLISLLEALNKKPELKELYFLALIQTAKFALMKGELDEADHYMRQASLIYEEVQNNNYRALFWYAYSWINKERGKYDDVLKNSDNFSKVKTNKDYPIHLFMLNLSAFSQFHLGDNKNACLAAEKVYYNALEYFQSDNSDIAAESLITLAKCDMLKGDFNKAHNKINRAIEVMNIVFGDKDIDLTQAVAHSMLGEIYERRKQYKEAFKEYEFAENYYGRIYQNKFPPTVEIGNLFTGIALLGMKIHDKLMIKRYLNRLVDIFGYDSFYVHKVLNELDNNNIVW